MPNNAEHPEKPNIISLDTFDDIKAYFDQKFSHLKCKLSNDQVKSSSSLAKKLKSEMNSTFKFSGNKKQLELNMETLEHISQSFSFVHSLKSLVDLEHSNNQEVSALILKLDESFNATLKARRNKLIRIADKCKLLGQKWMSIYLMKLLLILMMRRKSGLPNKEP